MPEIVLTQYMDGPLVRTYIYNEEYDAQNIVVEAAIECVGALASKLCWKKYAKLLQQFLSQVSGHIFNLQKNRKKLKETEVN